MKIRFVESERLLLVNYTVYSSFYCKGVYHQYHQAPVQLVLSRWQRRLGLALPRRQNWLEQPEICGISLLSD
jgi:hypothetical protein